MRQQGLHPGNHGQCSLTLLPDLLWIISCKTEHPFRPHVSSYFSNTIFTRLKLRYGRTYKRSWSLIGLNKRLHVDSTLFLTARSSSKWREWTSSKGEDKYDEWNRSNKAPIQRTVRSATLLIQFRAYLCKNTHHSRQTTLHRTQTTYKLHKNYYKLRQTTYESIVFVTDFKWHIFTLCLMEEMLKSH
jgi:hypothetical protein